MNYQRIGVCSLCNGDVMAYVGPWAGVGPAPGPKCHSCGAVPSRGPVIPMEVPRSGRTQFRVPNDDIIPAASTAVRIVKEELAELHARTDKRVRGGL